MKCIVLLVSPYNAVKVGGIGTWSKSILDYAQMSDKCDVIFQNTANALKGNIKGSRLSRLFWGIEDTAIILLKLFFNMLFRRPDVVHYTSSASWALKKDKIALFIVKSIFRKKFVIHWHFGRIPEICVNKNKEYKDLVYLINQSDAAVVLDEKSLKCLIEEGHSNVYYIPNPLTSEVYYTAREVNPRNLLIQRQEGVVLFVGHVIKEKGVFELVEACLEAPEVKCLIMIGPVLQEVKSLLEKIASKRENGRWLLFEGELQRKKVFDYYKRCSVFCLPSYTEGFPYVILEAMAFGCPIVATSVGAIPQMITPATGVLVHPRDVDGLRNAILSFLSNSEKRIETGINARREVLSHYTTDQVMSSYEDLWLSLVK